MAEHASWAEMEAAADRARLPENRQLAGAGHAPGYLPVTSSRHLAAASRPSPPVTAR